MFGVLPDLKLSTNETSIYMPHSLPLKTTKSGTENFRLKKKCHLEWIFAEPSGFELLLCQYYFTTGCKPSIWFPPGGLVEQNFRARNSKKNWILNLLLSFCLFISLFFSCKSDYLIEMMKCIRQMKSNIHSK